mgnify:CR=1 FL=1
MKKLYFLFFDFAFFILADAKAQIKLHDDGHVSLGSLTKDYGIQIQPNGYSYFRTRLNNKWSWATLSYANDSLQKHWIVANLDDPNPGKHTFFVTGHGYIYKNGTLQRADGRFQQEEQQIEDARNVLDQITGIWYVPTEEGGETKSKTSRRVGVSAQEVEKVLPEAVATDEDGVLYVDYEALTVFLIEAVKEQNKEIEALQKTLQSRGLLEP